jgi:tRNA(Ile)-lysidine synthetase-like protein
LAVSGGADSMALWDLLARLGRWRLAIFHLNHELRDDAHLDEVLIRQRDAKYRAASLPGAHLLVENCNIAEAAKRWGCGLESAGRRQRYERLKLLAIDCGAAAVVTAHHRDDQAETVLSNLLRGAGPVGRAGIPPQRELAPNIPLLRPLLPFTRDQLRAHLESRSLTWREDETNTDQRFTRNFLRRSVLPSFERIAPGFTVALAEMAEQSRTTLQANNVLADEQWRKRLTPLQFSVMGIRAQPDEVRYLLWRRLLKELHLPLVRRHLFRLDQMAFGPHGQRFRLGQVEFLRRRDALVWENAKPTVTVTNVTIEGPGEYWRDGIKLCCVIVPKPQEPHLFSGFEAVIDHDALAWPLEWRLARPRERWQPLGCPGRQTVIKTLAERKVPSRLRPLIPVLADANGVVWLTGFCIADRVRISDDTRRALRISVLAEAEDISGPVLASKSVPGAFVMKKNSDVSAVILAAGKGTRMESDKAKVLHELDGKPLVAHVLDSCAELGVGQTVVVVGYQRERVEAAIIPWNADSVVQDKQLGTGHAVLCTQQTVRGKIVLVLCGDCPLTQPELLLHVIETHRKAKAACTAVAARLSDPGRYGRMITDAQGKLQRIVEFKDASEQERAVNLINSGIYAFNASDLFRCLQAVRPNNAQGEYYLTDVVGMLVGEKKPVELVITEDAVEVMGINTPAELKEAEQILGQRKKYERD